MYQSAQRQFIDFWRQDSRANQDGSILPANEETLIRFASLLADNLSHSSIKVYLSAVRSLHIDHGLPDPLVNCLRLQRVLGGIKRVEGPASPRRLLITVDHLKAFQRFFDLSTRDHVMLWAACCLGFLFFYGLGSSRSTPCLIRTSIHL